MGNTDPSHNKNSALSGHVYPSPLSKDPSSWIASTSSCILWLKAVSLVKSVCQAPLDSLAVRGPLCYLLLLVAVTASSCCCEGSDHRSAPLIPALGCGVAQLSLLDCKTGKIENKQ